MQRISRDQMIRVALTAVILLSGLAMVPFIDLPAQAAITWQSLAGVYEMIVAKTAAPTFELSRWIRDVMSYSLAFVILTCVILPVGSSLWTITMPSTSGASR